MNPKNICISAGIGFVLSFIIGLISRVGVPFIFIRAFIFALVFAALCIGISFVYGKFLSENVRGVENSDLGTPVQKSPVGNMINIVVDDSKLPDDDQAPKFSVENNRPSLGAEDLASKESSPVSRVQTSENEAKYSAPQENTVTQNDFTAAGAENVLSSDKKNDPVPQSEKSSGFTPVGLDAVTASAPSQLPANEAHQEASGEDEESLDSLPEINDLTLSGSGEKGEVISDSEFALGGGSSASSSAEKSNGQDTNVMAQAIRTILAQDN